MIDIDVQRDINWFKLSKQGNIGSLVPDYKRKKILLAQILKACWTNFQAVWKKPVF